MIRVFSGLVIFCFSRSNPVARIKLSDYCFGAPSVPRAYSRGSLCIALYTVGFCQSVSHSDSWRPMFSSHLILRAEAGSQCAFLGVGPVERYQRVRHQLKHEILFSVQTLERTWKMSHWFWKITLRLWVHLIAGAVVSPADAAGEVARDPVTRILNTSQFQSKFCQNLARTVRIDQKFWNLRNSDHLLKYLAQSR